MDIPILVHVFSAGIALLAGTISVCVLKGSAIHKKAGYGFVATMIIMAIPAGIISYSMGKPFDSFSSIFTCYFVLTGFLAFRINAKLELISLMGLAGMCMAGYLTVEISTQMTGIRNTDAPIGAGYIFSTVLAIAIWGDFKQLRQPLLRRQTLARHLWRMSIGFFMATVNLFGVRPYLFPGWLQSSGILILLTFAPLFVMTYWFFKLRPQVRKSKKLAS